MKKLGAVAAGASLAMGLALALGATNARADEKQITVDCTKVMEALNGPDVTPRHVAGSMHIPLYMVHKCMDEAKKSLGTSHPAVGPGGAYTDPNDPATKFKHSPW
ncbi:MAG: hypothetical protein ABSD31_05230 [Candidatus Binataceae bacterium]|jgi:hypothetical protein